METTSLIFNGRILFIKKSKQKSKEFFNQIIEMENISPKIKLEVQKRLRSDFSE